MKVPCAVGAMLLLIAPLSALTLSEAYEKALSNEGRVQTYRYKLKASEEAENQAASRLYPAISASARSGGRRYAPRYVDEVRNELTSSFSATLVQPLYHPEYLSEWDSAEFRSQVDGLQYEKEKSALGREVAKAYFEVKRTQAGVALSRSYLQANEAKYEQIEKTFSFGMSSKVDLLEAKVNLDDARIQQLRDRKHLEVAHIYLARLINEEVTALPDEELDALEIESLGRDGYEAWKTRVKNNIDLRLAAYDKSIADLTLQDARYGHYPKVDVRLFFSKTDSTDIYTYRDDTRAEIEVNIPIFQGGYVQSRIKEAQWRCLAADQEIAQYRRIADLMFEETWEQFLASKEHATVLREAVESAELYMHSIEKSHQKGLKSLFDLYDAKTRLFKVRHNLLDTLYEVVIAYINLLDVTGELTLDRIVQLDALFFKETVAE